MITNFQLTIAPLAVLALLGTAGLTAMLIAGAGFFALGRQRGRALRLTALAVAVPVLYGGVLLGLAGLSHEVIVPPGGEKHFCEIDCHIAYAVTGVDAVTQLAAARPRGTFLIVSLRTRFDETTIGPRRGNGALMPNPRALSLLDLNGLEIPLSEAGSAALAATEGAQPPLGQPLRPGESYVTRLVFDVPAGSAGLRLWIRESDWPNRLLLGHENSPGHGHALLALPAVAAAKTAA